MKNNAEIDLIKSLITHLSKVQFEVKIESCFEDANRLLRVIRKMISIIVVQRV